MKLGALKRALGAAALGLAFSASTVGAKGEAAPLFSATAPLEVTITGPIRELIKKAPTSTDPFPATITVNAETLPIALAARGITRRKRDICPFPPMLMRFDPKPADASLFDKQGRVKIVTHCRTQESFDRLVLKEYAAYRLYNRITPESLNVRLARMRYVDEGKEIAHRWGFFIEDVDDAAKRVSGKEVDVPSVPSAALDPDDAARYSLFQYMIGNLDWDMTKGPEGSDCCHNSKLIGADKEARTALTPVPYDFDYSGIVDSPYAVAPEVIPVRSVKERYYRGLCRHNEAVQRGAAEFIAARPALEAELDAIAELAPKDRDAMRKYLASFFADIATPTAVEKNLLRNCR